LPRNCQSLTGDWRERPSESIEGDRAGRSH
jgi:hypothetical protein